MSNLVPRAFFSFKMAVGETPGQGCQSGSKSSLEFRHETSLFRDSGESVNWEKEREKKAKGLPFPATAPILSDPARLVFAFPFYFSCRPNYLRAWNRLHENRIKCLRFVQITVSDWRKQTGLPNAKNNLRKSHFIMCLVTKYSRFVEYFSSVGKGFLRPPFWMRRRPWGRGCSMNRSFIFLIHLVVFVDLP